jgi:hypothetical protein
MENHFLRNNILGFSKNLPRIEMRYNFAFQYNKVKNCNIRNAAGSDERMNCGLATRLYPALSYFVHIIYEDLEPCVMLEIVDA